MAKNKKFIHILLVLIFIAGFTSCKSTPKRDIASEDYKIDENYNPDDYYYGDGDYYGSGTNDYNYNYGGSTHSDILGMIKNRVWQLVEIRIGYGLIALDRQQMAYNNMNDVFIIQFTDEGVSGKAAPNRYFAPYEKQEGKNISIRQIVGTLMGGNINIGGLTENEYYWYLQRITRMDIVNGYLELYATPSPNEEIVLRYRVE